MKKFVNKFMKWSLPTKLGLVLGVLGLMWVGNYVIQLQFNSEVNNSVESIITVGQTGDNVMTKTTTYASQQVENNSGLVTRVQGDVTIHTGNPPIFVYEITSPSQKQSDGLYYTDFNIIAINIPINELVDTGFRYHKGLTCDTIRDKDIEDIMTSRPETGGLMMSGFKIAISCTSNILVPENHQAKLFTYIP